MRLLLVAATVIASLSIALVKADITVANPLTDQLPQIAHVGAPYTWTIEVDTFAITSDDSSDGPAMAYNATGLPTWVVFDQSTLTFTGSPNATDVGSTEVTVTASLADGSMEVESASSTFTLLTIQEPAPTLSLPIAQQLLDPASNSLGPKSVLPPGNILHIPPGWSFSMGFDGDTFTLADGNQVHMSASVNGTTDLPSWMTWSADTYTLYGVAPSAQIGESIFNVTMTGSNRAGFGGVTDSFQIEVAAHVLSLGTPLRSVNASVGDTFDYQIPTTGLQLDQRQNSNISNPVNITVNLGDNSWLMYDQEAASITGAPPYEQYGNATTTQVVSLPIVFSDTYGNSVPANLTINIAPYGFTTQTIPNVVVASGKEVNLELSQYIRNISSPVSLAVENSTADDAATSAPAVTANFFPANATEWLDFDADTLMLSGIMPSDPNTRVKVNLQLTNSNNQSSSASLYVETPAASSSSGDSTTGSSNTPKHGSGSSGLSHRAKVALGVSLGAVGGLLALILLMICCRRHVAKEEHDHHGYITDDRDDQTLTDSSPNSKFKKAIVISRPQGSYTPNTIVASPYIGHEKQAASSAEPAMLASVMVEDPTGQKRDATNEGDEPTQSRLMNNLFGGKKKTATANNNGHVEPPTGLGLGLGMDDPYSNMGAAMTNSRSQGGIGNFESERSMRTHRSSWESDLFYEDANAAPVLVHNSLTASDTADDVPRRRGATGNELTVRHRNTHHNASPAFNAPGMFTPPEDNGSHSSLARAQDADYSSEAYGSAGQLSGRALEEAQIMEAKVLQVRRHSPMIQTNGNPFSQARGRSAEAEERANSGAFDDAEWETETEGHISDVPTRRQNQNQRISAMSAMTDSSQMQAMRGYYANEAVVPAPPLRQPDIFSPNPSFMDGASVSNYEPQDTIRAITVPSRPRTPPNNPFARHQHSASSTSKPASVRSTASRFLACPNVPAIVNYPVRFHIYPTVPPPMAGAPGSPGKRSGDGVRYSLIVDDSRPHLAPFRLTWPDMLGDWLTFNDATFEAFGIVPNNAGLEDLGDVEIALIAVKRTAKVPPSPKASGNSSPTRRHHKRTSTLSFDSSHTVVTEDDITVVARAKLVFQTQVY